jgi:DNA-binding LytR/AlgR family response regulator
MKLKDINPDQITHIQGDGNYSRVILTEGYPILISQTLARFEPLMPAFIRVSKSALVNPKFIAGVQKSDTFFCSNMPLWEIVLNNGLTIMIPRRRREIVVKQVMETLQVNKESQD